MRRILFSASARAGVLEAAELERQVLVRKAEMAEQKGGGAPLPTPPRPPPPDQHIASHLLFQMNQSEVS